MRELLEEILVSECDMVMEPIGPVEGTVGPKRQHLGAVLEKVIRTRVQFVENPANKQYSARVT